MSIRFKKQIRIFLRKFIKPQYGLSLLVISTLQWLLRGVFDEWFFSDLLEVIGGEPMTNYLIYLPIFLILAILLKMYFDSKRELKSEIEKSIPNLLWKMHNRMTGFEEIRAKQDIDNEVLNRVMEMVADRVGIVKLEDSKRIQEDIKKHLGLGTRVPKGKKRVKELSLKVAGLIRTFPMPEKEWGLNDSIKIGESLDGEKVGIGRLRDLDKKWQRWMKELTSLQQIYADKQLDNLISVSIFKSYGCCSTVLYSTYCQRVGNNEILSMAMSIVRSEAANIRVWVNDAINDTIRSVINRLKELQSSENIDGHDL